MLDLFVDQTTSPILTYVNVKLLMLKSFHTLLAVMIGDGTRDGPTDGIMIGTTGDGITTDVEIAGDVDHGDMIGLGQAIIMDGTTDGIMTGTTGDGETHTSLDLDSE